MERPERETFATRFDAYVVELRDVFAASGLRAGQPKDMTAIAQAVGADGRLKDDAAAVVRSILYREQEGLSRAELASIVVVAAGGADLYASAQEGEAVYLLDDFAHGVRQGMRDNARGDLRDEIAPPEGNVRAEREPVVQEEEVHAEPDTDRILEQVAPQVEQASARTGIYTQARMMAERQRKGGGEDTYFLKAARRTGVEGSPEEFTLSRKGRASGAFWLGIAGLCSLVLLMVAGFAWRHQSAGDAHRVPAAGVELPSTVATAGPAASPAMIGQGASLPPGNGAGAGGTGVVSPVRRTDVGSKTSALPGSSAPSGQGGSAGGSSLPAAIAGTGTGLGSAANAGSVSAGKDVPHAVPSVERPAEPKHAVARPAAPAVATARIGGDYVVSSGVMSSHLVSAPAPGYPRMAKMWGVEGQVVLQAVISSKGKVMTAKVLDGHSMLRGSATKAVKKWRYRPYLQDGKPTDIATVVIVDYKLKP